MSGSEGHVRSQLQRAAHKQCSVQTGGSWRAAQGELVCCIGHTSCSGAAALWLCCALMPRPHGPVGPWLARPATMCTAGSRRRSRWLDLHAKRHLRAAAVITAMLPLAVGLCLLVGARGQSTGASYAPANTIDQTATSGIALSTNVTGGLAVAPAYVQVRNPL